MNVELPLPTAGGSKAVIHLPMGDSWSVTLYGMNERFVWCKLGNENIHSSSVTVVPWDNIESLDIFHE